jgi:hypothetical protein
MSNSQCTASSISQILLVQVDTRVNEKIEGKKLSSLVSKRASERVDVLNVRLLEAFNQFRKSKAESDDDKVQKEMKNIHRTASHGRN